MSDVLDSDDREEDRKRSLVSLGAAVAAHVVLFAAFAIFIASSGPPPALPAVTIQLQGGSDVGSVAANPGGGSSSAGPAQSAAVSPAAGSAGAASPGFVIPTPRAGSPGSSAPSGPAFQESGGRTGVTQSIPASPSSQPGPVVPPVPQGRGSGSAASAGSGASSAQRSGTGVAVGGAASSGGPLDLSKLDKSLAQGSGRASGTGSGSGAGTGSGSGTGTGTGSGSGSGTGSGTGSGGYSVQWGTGAGEGRSLVHDAFPALPAFVSQQGLRLSVTVRFTVAANGVVMDATIQQSSGFARVDSAVLDAIRLCLFNEVPNAPPVTGVRQYVISPK